MIEKEILDRVPLNPGRITLSPVDGMENTFDMVRADNPTVEGTPINKATLDSIIQSRLTGRYYEPAVMRTKGEILTLTTNPIPERGWTEVTETGAKNSGYELVTTPTYSNNYPDQAVDGNASTFFYSAEAVRPYFIIKLAEPITVKKIITQTMISGGGTGIYSFWGSNDGVTWDKLLGFSTSSYTEQERTLTTPGKYSQYKLDVGGTFNLNVATLAISEYSFETYTNAYTIVNGVPSTWTVGQRILLFIPPETPTIGIMENTLNGIPVNTILLAGKRYELRYTGTSFAVKEV